MQRTQQSKAQLLGTPCVPQSGKAFLRGESEIRQARSWWVMQLWGGEAQGALAGVTKMVVMVVVVLTVTG